MVQVIIHRGSQEIGGNAVELNSPQGRILLDLGMPLDSDIRKTEDISVLLEKGLLPNIEGLYSNDIPSFDAILLSHAHADHSGFLHYTHPDIPLVLSQGSKVLMDLSARFLRQPPIKPNHIIFEMYKPFNVSDINITPYLMDHSAFDAAAFEIQMGDTRIVYTGDFRRHGRKSNSFERFLKRVEPSPDLLLSEGTLLGRGSKSSQTEEELEMEIYQLLRSNDGIALFQCSSQNIDRLVTLYKAALRSGRHMVIDNYTAAVLAELRKLGNKLPSCRTHPNITIHRPEEAKKTLMLIRPSHLSKLKEDESIKDGIFLYSLWSGYRDQEKQKELEEFLKGRNIELIEAHTSGHADVDTLQTLLEQLNPKKIIPIHTLYPEQFKDFSDRVHIVQDGEIIKINDTTMEEEKMTFNTETDSLKQELLETINHTRDLLAQNDEWHERYKKYAKKITDNLSFIKSIRSSFYQRGPLAVYLTTTPAIATSGKMDFSLRYHGIPVATISGSENDTHKVSTIKKKPKRLKEIGCEIDFKNADWLSKEATEFRNFFLDHNLSTAHESRKRSREIHLESIWLSELQKESEKILPNAKAITIENTRFPMPTPIKASKPKNIKYSGSKGGGIDIFARVGRGPNTYLCVFELKDENVKKEPPRQVIKQALAYTTFIRELLRSDSGDLWWKLFGFNGKMPKPLTLFTACLMPSSEYNDYSFKDMELPIGDDIIKLHYVYFTEENNKITSVDASFKWLEEK